MNVTTKDVNEEHRYALALRHKLAMESIGLIRTCIHVQRPMFDALLELEKSDDHVVREVLHSKSFVLQIKMVRATIDYMDQLDALAEEVLELAVKSGGIGSARTNSRDFA